MQIISGKERGLGHFFLFFFFFFFVLKYEHKSLGCNIVTLVNRFRGSCIETGSFLNLEIYFLRDSKKRHVVGSFLCAILFLLL